MSKITIIAETNQELSKATELAQRLDLPIGSAEEDCDFQLLVTASGLSLHQTGKATPGPISVDFVKGKAGHRRLFGRRRREPLGLAVGAYKNKFHVFDATAGMGQDGFLLACLGCQVTMIERIPVVAALLEDGLQRALEDSELAEILDGRLAVVEGDAKEVLQSLTEEIIADVVYIDVMYPEKKKSALPTKEMQVLRSLVGEDADAEELFHIAREVAKSRVIVKRPIHAEPLFGTPTESYKDPKTRFDVYFRVDRMI